MNLQRSRLHNAAEWRTRNWQDAYGGVWYESHTTCPLMQQSVDKSAVAEEMHQPLYMVNASELGETVTEVEQSLDQICELATKWNAILLLDECDIFLEARSTSNIRRSHLVSGKFEPTNRLRLAQFGYILTGGRGCVVFLRQLEYYRGVMFLTSNRISDFDPAFDSRIHLTIHYPALDLQSRLHIWSTFIDVTNPDTSISSAQLASLARLEMNGRQIKNIVKTARLLSGQAGSPLKLQHIEMVLKNVLSSDLVTGKLGDGSPNSRSRLPISVPSMDVDRWMSIHAVHSHSATPCAAAAHASHVAPTDASIHMCGGKDYLLVDYLNQLVLVCVYSSDVRLWPDEPHLYRDFF
nr:hypothetical protein CFP56_76109 [Quercus suber]